MLSNYGKREWLLIGAAGLILVALFLFCGWWFAALLAAGATAAVLSFFRDPARTVTTLRGHFPSPADGRISSIHDVEYFEPFDGPARCVRIFMSVLNVHVNRSPVHGRVMSVHHKDGQYLNAMKAESAEHNESVLIVLGHPIRQEPIASVRQVAGAVARRIVCGVVEGDIVQRGQRFGMIKFGSTVELYLPQPDRVKVQVRMGQKVYGGSTVLAIVESAQALMPVDNQPVQAVDQVDS